MGTGPAGPGHASALATREARANPPVSVPDEPVRAPCRIHGATPALRPCSTSAPAHTPERLPPGSGQRLPVPLRPSHAPPWRGQYAHGPRFPGTAVPARIAESPSVSAAYTSPPRAPPGPWTARPACAVGQLPSRPPRIQADAVPPYPAGSAPHRESLAAPETVRAAHPRRPRHHDP